MALGCLATGGGLCYNRGMPPDFALTPASGDAHRLDGVARQALAVWLAVALFGLYFLTYAGRFESADAVSFYTVSESIAKRGALDGGPFVWDRWMTDSYGAQGD